MLRKLFGLALVAGVVGIYGCGPEEVIDGPTCQGKGLNFCATDTTKCYDACTAGSWDGGTCACSTTCDAPKEVCGGNCLAPCEAEQVRNASCACISVTAVDVLEVFPANRAEVDNLPAPLVSAKFNTAMKAESISAVTTVKVTNLVTYAVSYDSALKTAFITSTAGFDEYTTYKITIVGGANGVKGEDGGTMTHTVAEGGDNYTWKFYTKLVRAVDSIVLPRTGIVWWTFASGGSLADPMTSASYTNYGIIGQSSPLTIPTSGSEPCSVSLNYTNCSGFIWHMNAEL